MQFQKVSAQSKGFCFFKKAVIHQAFNTTVLEEHPKREVRFENFYRIEKTKHVVLKSTLMNHKNQKQIATSLSSTNLNDKQQHQMHQMFLLFFKM